MSNGLQREQEAMVERQRQLRKKRRLRKQIFKRRGGPLLLSELDNLETTAIPNITYDSCVEGKIVKFVPPTGVELKRLSLLPRPEPVIKVKKSFPPCLTPFENEVAIKLIEEGYTIYRNGWPDFLCTREKPNGTVEILGVEVKAAGDALTTNQEDMHKVLRGAGIGCIVVRKNGPRSMFITNTDILNAEYWSKRPQWYGPKERKRRDQRKAPPKPWHSV